MTTPQISLTSGRSWGQAPASLSALRSLLVMSQPHQKYLNTVNRRQHRTTFLNMHGEKSFNLNMCWWKLLMLTSK